MPPLASCIDSAYDVHQKRKEAKTMRWAEGPVYLWPKTRYSYWTPRGLRGDDDLENHDPLARFLMCSQDRKPIANYDNDDELGLRTSALISFWHLDFQSVCARHEFIEIAR